MKIDYDYLLTEEKMEIGEIMKNKVFLMLLSILICINISGCKMETVDNDIDVNSFENIFGDVEIQPAIYTESGDFFIAYKRVGMADTKKKLYVVPMIIEEKYILHYSCKYIYNVRKTSLGDIVNVKVENLKLKLYDIQTAELIKEIEMTDLLEGYVQRGWEYYMMQEVYYEGEPGIIMNFRCMEAIENRHIRDMDEEEDYKKVIFKMDTETVVEDIDWSLIYETSSGTNIRKEYYDLIEIGSSIRSVYYSTYDKNIIVMHWERLPEKKHKLYQKFPQLLEIKVKPNRNVPVEVLIYLKNHADDLTLLELIMSDISEDELYRRYEYQDSIRGHSSNYEYFQKTELKKQWDKYMEYLNSKEDK